MDTTIRNESAGSVNVNQGGTQTNHNISGSHNQFFNGTVSIYAAGSEEQRLDAVNPWSNHATARDRYHPGTCSWVLRREEYLRWRSGETRCLWLHGKPGCGKTVICSMVIEDLLEYYKDSPDIKLAYFYFTFSDIRKQSYADMLLSLVCQFGRYTPELLRSVPTGADIHTLLNVLRSMLSTFGQAFVVLDALDESPDRLRRDLLLRLVTLAGVSNIRIFTAARNDFDIAESLGDAFEQLPTRTEDVCGDIQDYVAAQLESVPRLRSFKPDVKSMIKRNACGNADGMFRWAYLLLDAMKGLRISSPSAVKRALEQFPKDLDEVYIRTLQQVADEDRIRVFTLLQWIAYAQRPLRLEELAETLAIKPEYQAVEVEDRCEPEDILRLLTSLVTTMAAKHRLSAGSSVIAQTRVQLAHFTVREHLESNRYAPETAMFHLEYRVGHVFLTQCCVTYLMHYSKSDARQINWFDHTTFPLLDYAAESCDYHSEQHERDSSFEMQVLISKSDLQSWVSLAPFYPLKRFTVPRHDPVMALYHMSSLGSAESIRELLNMGCDVNAEKDGYDSALTAAARNGHLETVKLLLDRGAIDLNGALKGAAAKTGHLEIVKLLLDQGADDLSGALQGAAAGYGTFRIVELLLDRGASNLNEALKEAKMKHIKGAESRKWDCFIPMDPSGEVIDHRRIAMHAAINEDKVVRLLKSRGAVER